MFATREPKQVSVERSNAKTTSLWFKEFDYQEGSLKHLIKTQNQSDIGNFLKYQMNSQVRNKEEQQVEDKGFMKHLDVKSKEQIRNEQKDLIKKN